MAHPYRWPVLGFESDIRNWKKEDLRNYFKTYYAPNNCVAVVVGDVKAKKVRELARIHFEPIPPAAPPRPVHTVEPEQRGEKRVRVIKDVTAPVIMIAYHGPEARSPDFHAVDLLASILGDGRSSRLHAALVDEKQLAVEAEIYFSRSIDPNLITFWTVCRKGVTAEALEKGVDAEVERLLAGGVTEAELEKAKKKVLVNHFRNLQTINGKANGLGAHEIHFGDFRKLFSAPQAYRKVTREQVAKAAGKYLKETNRTVGVLARKGAR
jgi:predicted Zn-dependent peptidase